MLRRNEKFALVAQKEIGLMKRPKVARFIGSY
jgi:hypothetical protein